MPPLNACEEQVDSYYPTLVQDSRANSPFDDEDEEDFLEEDLEETLKREQEESVEDKKPDRSLFLNFNADLNPQNTAKKPKPKKATTYKVNGVNILNRKSLDSKTVMERLKRRRENHNSVERKRRDNINHTILEISQLIPHETTNAKLNKGSILRLAADYIKEVQAENQRLVAELKLYKTNTHAQLSEERTEERIGYPIRPYTQLLHDQLSYPVHPRTGSVHENLHFALPKTISQYQSSIKASSMDTTNCYFSSQSSHSNLSKNSQNSVLSSQTLHGQAQSITHHHSPTHISPQAHLPSTRADHHLQSTSIPKNPYSSFNLPTSDVHSQQASISAQPYTPQPIHRHSIPSSVTAVPNLLPPLYQSAQQQRKGMMFGEFNGALNLF